MWCRRTKKIGIAAICIGLMIILAMVIPTGFWFFLLGLFFILVGLLMCRK